MSDQDTTAGDQQHEESHKSSRHRHHRHKYRTRERVRLKENSGRTKRKLKKYLTIFSWIVLIILFFVSMFFLVKELNHSGLIKDRRNSENILFQEIISNPIFKT
jgi:hypothetical protein